MMANVRKRGVKNARTESCRQSFAQALRRMRIRATRLSFRAACAAANAASELPHQADHLVLLRARDLREHRQRDNAALVGMGVRELLRAVLEAAIGFEEWQR